MKCNICGQSIALIPSAQERAARHGGKAIDYTRLFTQHADCALQKRNRETSDLIKRRAVN